MTFTSLGLFATLAPLAFYAYYAASLYSDLTGIRADLVQSAQAAEIARNNLVAARGVLRQASQGQDVSQRAVIANALNRVEVGELALKDVTYSLAQASNRLTFEPAMPTKPERWFVVVESYANTSEGLRLAKLRMEKLSETGNCAQIWRTRTGNMLSVVLGEPTDENSAMANAQSAKAISSSSGAYARLDLRNNWTLISRSAQCKNLAVAVRQTNL